MSSSEERRQKWIRHINSVRNEPGRYSEGIRKSVEQMWSFHLNGERYCISCGGNVYKKPVQECKEIRHQNRWTKVENGQRIHAIGDQKNDPNPVSVKPATPTVT
ncbi:MAG TPA: hypothetical protein VEP90_28405 [Methylomirabilota bacterium]|nr:hypothetical protein [Methylomirabilota bacterium]